MKRVVLACVVSLLATSAFAELSKDEVKRLNESVAVLTELVADDAAL